MRERGEQKSRDCKGRGSVRQCERREIGFLVLAERDAAREYFIRLQLSSLTPTTHVLALQKESVIVPLRAESERGSKAKKKRERD